MVSPDSGFVPGFPWIPDSRGFPDSRIPQAKNGTIEIPEVYRRRLKERVRVIPLAEEESTTVNLIDQLLQRPLKVAGFKPLNREEIYERT
jgi:hypothetical protein